MDDKERLNALEVALSNEMREREFYLKNADRTTNPVGKAMFERIAEDEMEHYNRLKELHTKWKAKDKWPESIPLKVSETNIRDILVNMVKKVEKTAKGDADDIEAIKTAVDFEEKGARLYSELRDASSNPREKEFFDLLAMIEHEHYLSLRDAEEYLTDPTSWFIKTEHHTLDGA